MSLLVTDFRKAAKCVNRLYREREAYLTQADSLRGQAEYVRVNQVNRPLYDELMTRAADAVAWAIGLQPQIDRATKDLEQAISARKDW